MTAGIANKVVALTGASSGIGEAAARLLAAGGARLLLLARREDRLRALADELGEGSIHVAVDVTDCEQMVAAMQTGIDHLGHIDVLVNNAGIMPLSPMAKGRVGRVGCHGGHQHQGGALRHSRCAGPHA